MAAPIRIRSHSQFIRETAVPGAVFRGQTNDYGNLIPAFYRQRDRQIDLDDLLKLGNRCFVESHEQTHHLGYRSGIYLTGHDLFSGPYPRLPDFSALLGGEPSDDSAPFAPLRVEMPFERLQLWMRSMTDAAAADELATREQEDDERNWETFAPEAEFINTYDEPAYALARLQHYGVPTPALDVTSDRYIAAWFAGHQFVETGPEAGYYTPHDAEGVVYVLMAVVSDLRRSQVIPLAGVRAHRQAGAVLLGATREDPDLSRFVVKTLIVPARFLRPPLWRIRDRWGARRLDQRWLFPDGSSDTFYGELLRLKSKGYAGALSRWVVRYVDAPE